MKKVLLICGPTATGKTDLAFFLADKFPSLVISADSRQVYKGMDIVTGKDRSTKHPLYGIDLVDPDQPFSVAHFVNFSHDLINQSEHKNRLPLIVGGTGLYLNSFLKPPATINIQPNTILRHQLGQLPLADLQQRLQNENPEKWASMNHSDKLNPRRLIRALEVTQTPVPQGQTLRQDFIPLWIGLKAPLPVLSKRIEARVQTRIKQGALVEWQKLALKYDPHLPSMSAIGYRQLPNIEAWITAEIQYARRQLTWFKNQPQINWFNTTASDYKANIAKLVDTWYTK